MTTILYFSPTGNVKYLAERLSQLLDTTDTTLLPLEFTEPLSLDYTDHLVIMFSIHAFNAPRTVQRFLRNLPEGLTKSVSIVSVGCNETWINSAASLPLKKILTRKGYVIIVDQVMAMPLTLVLKFPTGLTNKTIVAAEMRIAKIAQAIQSNNTLQISVPIKSKMLQKVGKAEDLASRFFGLELHAHRSCTSCDICIERCPEKNITYSSAKKPIFGFSCLMCLRCIYECPEKAISPWVSKFIPIKGGYDIKDYIA